MLYASAFQRLLANNVYKLIPFCALCLLAASAEAYSVSLFGPFLGNLLEYTPETDELTKETSKIIGTGLLFLVIMPATVTARIGCIKAAFELGEKISTDYIAESFEGMIKQSLREFVNIGMSEYISLIAIDSERCASCVAMFLQLISSSLVALFLACEILRIDFSMGLGILCMGLMGYLAMETAVKGKRERTIRKISNSYNERTEVTLRTLKSFRNIRIEHGTDNAVRRFRVAERRYRSARNKSQFDATFPRYALEGGGIVLIGGILLSLVLAGELKAVAIVGSLALGVQRLLPALQSAYYSYSEFKVNLIGVEMLDRFQGSSCQTKGVEDKCMEVKEVGVFSGLTVDQLECRTENGDLIFENVSCTLSEDQSLVITGKSGAGKSTLLEALMGLRDLESGRIRYALRDNNQNVINIESGELEKLKGLFSYMPQEPYIFDGTLIENISGEEFSTEGERRLAEEILRGLEFTTGENTSEVDLDIRLGSKGRQLSGGECQKVGLARALVKRPLILVVDEGTSALDRASSIKATEVMLSGRYCSSVISVSHQDWLWDMYDKKLDIGREKQGRSSNQNKRNSI